MRSTNEPGELLFTVQEIGVMLHVAAHSPKFGVPAKLAKDFGDVHLQVVVQDAGVHIFLALTNDFVAAHSRKSHF